MSDNETPIDAVTGGVTRRDALVKASVVAAGAVVGQRAPLRLHLVRGLPATRDHLAHAAHGLRVRREHAEGAEIVQDVFGGDGLAPDA